ncbi:hypothetical protein [Bifidobacterium pullorum]|uniref:hypothetical protein n=1 Tax=Bifidobacterium pullorum TaxID=78448 RepID=UPI00052A118D|nr:hypothetical protein [Bifidobacterium pullorum]
MSILDNIKDFAKDHGVNLDNGLGLDDLAAVGEDIKGMAENAGLTPQELGEKLGQLKEMVGDKVDDIDLKGLAEKVGLPEDLVNKVLGK